MTIWQSKHWQELLLISGQAEKVFEKNGVFFEKRSIWFGKFWLFALWVEKHQQISFEEIQKLSIQEQVVFVQIETFFLEAFEKNIWKIWYYKKFITPHTALIDLSKTLDQILSEMKPKGRYNIKVAQKKWLIVENVEATQENIKIFYDLMCETTSRDHFSGNSLQYYETFLEKIPNAELIFVKSGDTVVSAGIFIFWEEISVYYYWASTSDKEYRNMMWPYLLQYFAIQKAKEKGSKWYDFLWVATPWDINSSLAWVTDFKSKFTSDFREVSRSYLYINKRFWYFVFQILRKLKK